MIIISIIFIILRLVRITQELKIYMKCENCIQVHRVALKIIECVIEKAYEAKQTALNRMIANETACRRVVCCFIYWELLDNI